MTGTGVLVLALAMIWACGSSSSDSPVTDAGVTVPVDAGTTIDAGGTDASTTTPVARLSVQGKDILGPDGKPIVLRGWNWGQWGTEQPQDAADNAAQGATIVRVPLRWWGDYPDGDDAYKDTDPGHIETGHLATLDKMIDDLAAAHVWVDLFFDSNCGQASVVHDTVVPCGTGTDGKPANFGNDPTMKAKLVEAWSFLANHYAGHAYIGMYEILAEPGFTCSGHAGCTDWTATPTFYASVLPTIRAQDPRTPVIVGPGGAYELKQIATALLAGEPNVIYTGDILSNGTVDSDVLAPALAFRDGANVPVFIQQVGIKKAAADAGAGAQQTLAALNAAGIGWTWWTYREPSAATNSGFAPYYKAKADTTWSVDQPWLDMIDGYFTR